jgi:hypothetical protein
MITDLNMLNDDSKKRKCTECGKNLNLFAGYRHPTLGPHFLLCKECYENVEKSVERWGRFVLWNSFNPEAPDPTFTDNYPFPYANNITQHKKTKLRRHFHQ